MHRHRRKLALFFLAVASVAFTPGCIGSFALTRDVLRRNQKIENKPGREALFVGLLIVPVYELSVIADLLVFNTAELFTDENPWTPEGTAPPTASEVEP